MTITEQQAQELRDWYAGLPEGLRKNKHKVYRKLMTERPVTGYEQPSPVNKDAWEYKPETYAKQVAQAAGITGADLSDPAAVRTKLLAWVKAASGDTLVERLFDAALAFREADHYQGSTPDDSAATEQSPEPIYGQTKAEEIGVQGATMAEIEQARDWKQALGSFPGIGIRR